jgi:hypothetical protein
MKRGLLYLVAILDWFTRKILAWRISNTSEAEFCVEAFKEAVHRFGAPENMNNDQGSQFTSLPRPTGSSGPAQGYRWTASAAASTNLNRAPVAVLEVRMCLPARLGNGVAGESRNRTLEELSQSSVASRCPGRPNTCRGLLNQIELNPQAQQVA